MNDSQAEMELDRIVASIGPVEALKRLRSPGSGAEGRSQEEGRVSPGEAERLMTIGLRMQIVKNRVDRLVEREALTTTGEADLADIMQHASEVLESLMRVAQPDSKLAEQASGRRKRNSPDAGATE